MDDYKEYFKEYYEQNKETIRQKAKEYREKNKEKIREQKKKYLELHPEAKERKAMRNAESYKENRDTVLLRCNNRRLERINFMNDIALRYRCQNSECKWHGNFSSRHLDFHHFDPTDKIIEVAKMTSSTYEKILIEINKCIVLCKNCHALVHSKEAIVTKDLKCNVNMDDVIKFLSKYQRMK